jgi:hypothetical protein
MSDAIQYANDENIPLGIVSLDQENAFDRVHHGYLLNVLKAFGFGDFFMQCINTIYTNVQSVLKVNNTLAAPFSFERGIRQGCSLSGQLYALCLEPLLHKLRSPGGLNGLELPCSTAKRCTQSAYADDVNALMTINSDFPVLESWIGVYERASNAKVNVSKTKGLWCGSWRTRIDKPLSLEWKNDGLKILGVYAGNTKIFANKTWDGMVEAMEEKLDRWKPFAKALSIRGRVLVINLLTASKLWHSLSSASPPPGLLSRIQRILVDFIWQGKHWVSLSELILPVNQGGQGVVHLVSRLRDFRLRFAHRFLNSTSQLGECHPSLYFSKYYFSKVGNLSYTTQLFLLKGKLPLTNIPEFYKDVLQTWWSFGIHRHMGPVSVCDILDEPLFHNPLIVQHSTGEPFVLDTFVQGGITTVRHLFDVPARRKLDVADLQPLVPVHSQRTLQKSLNSIWSAIPNSWMATLGLFVSGKCELGQLQGYSFSLYIPGADENSVYFTTLAKRAAYQLSIMLTHTQNESARLASPWLDILGTDISREKLYAHVYNSPHTLREGDLAWRFLHGSLSTATFFLEAGYLPDDACSSCGDVEDLEHMFLSCPRLAGVLTTVRRLAMTILNADTFTTDEYVFGPAGARKIPRTQTRLTQWILTQGKMATYVTRQHLMTGAGRTDALQEFRARIISRVMVVYDYHRCFGSVEDFERTWCINSALCSIVAGKLHCHI